MTISQINALRDKDLVPFLHGRLVKIYEPRDPSAGQAKAGIHKQGIILQEPNGENIELNILNAKMHLPRSEEGSLYDFKSVDGEGLRVHSYNDKISVDVGKDARFYAVKEDQAPAPKPRNGSAQPQGITIGVLARVYCEALRELELQLDGCKAWDALLQNPTGLTAAASTLFIESCKQGIPQRYATQAPVTENAPVKGDEIDMGNAPLEPPDAIIYRMILAPFPKDKIAERGESLAVDWCKVYDRIQADMVESGVNIRTLNDAYDEVARKVGVKDDATVARTIALNFKRFTEVVGDKVKPADDDLPPID
jgi:hypothetical protein